MYCMQVPYQVLHPCHNFLNPDNLSVIVLCKVLGTCNRPQVDSNNPDVLKRNTNDKKWVPLKAYQANRHRRGSLVEEP